VALVGILLTGAVAAREAPAPVVEASGESASQALAARVARIERLLDNQTLVDMATRLDSLQQEVDRLLGRLEEQNHEMEGLKKRQRQLYLDMDNRVRQLEQARAAAPATPPPATSLGTFVPAPVPGEAPATAPGTAPLPAAGEASPTTATAAPQADAAAERADYERAFELLKQGRYDLAVAAFKAFVKTHPRGQYADNAQYWLGEANYVQRNFKAALAEFERVVNDYPDSPKRADAMLKLGYTYQELGQNDQARLTLTNLLSKYPNSTAARLAQKRLQDLKRLP
jgi:tol-pal system protein YbgF